MAENQETWSYPNTDDRGVEPVILPQEPYEGRVCNYDRVLLREVPETLRGHVKTAVSIGRLDSCLHHYSKVIDDNEALFAPHVRENLKTLFQEGRQAAGMQQQAAWFEKFQDYLRDLRMTRAE